jgi:hypothetical protein
MLDKPISPLRQRMIDEMTARRFNEQVQKDCAEDARVFGHLMRPPRLAMSAPKSLRPSSRSATSSP